jgi:acetyl-CoA carboxylase beta subunit
MSTEGILLLYVVVTLGVVALLAMYTSHRQRRFAPTRSEDSIYKCADCEAVYTDDADVDLSRCPQCGRMNDPIRF